MSHAIYKGMIITHVQICPSSGKREAILEILRHVEASILGQPGCQDCAVFEQAQGGTAILYVERWRSAADLERHIRSALFLRVLLAMELASQEPDICFYEIVEAKGLPWITALRSQE